VHYGYRNSIAQILYSETQSINLKGSTIVVQCLACGGQEKFVGIRGKEKKKIRDILEHIEYENNYDLRSERTHLCPQCTKELTKGALVCPNCKLGFKNKSKLRSLIPGLGYFYVGQFFLGCVNVCVELILIGGLISFYLKLSQNLETAVLSIALFGGLYIFQKIALMVHANHFIDEYIPEIEVLRPRSSL
jgi:hypothetical protein